MYSLYPDPYRNEKHHLECNRRMVPNFSSALSSELTQDYETIGHVVHQVYHTRMLFRYALIGTDLERQMATAKLCVEPFLPLSKNTPTQ